MTPGSHIYAEILRSARTAPCCKPARLSWRFPQWTASSKRGHRTSLPFLISGSCGPMKSAGHPHEMLDPARNSQSYLKGVKVPDFLNTCILWFCESAKLAFVLPGHCCGAAKVDFPNEGLCFVGNAAVEGHWDDRTAPSFP